MLGKNEISITFSCKSYDAAEQVIALVEVSKILNRDMVSPIKGEGLAYFLNHLLEVTYPHKGNVPPLFANMVVSEQGEEHWLYVAAMCASIAKQIREVFPACDKKELKGEE